MIDNNYIASQQLQKAYKDYGQELAQVLNALTRKLGHKAADGYSCVGQQREYLELREAKKILSHLKFPDMTDAVRVDEMAWALQTLEIACKRELSLDNHELFVRIATTLDIILSEDPMPLDLQRKLYNEVLFIAGQDHVIPFPQAV